VKKPVLPEKPAFYTCLQAFSIKPGFFKPWFGGYFL
jgi:hypothetical protein